MPQLYTVSFTTQKLSNKYDQKGKLVAQERVDNPIVMTALPLATAQSYSKCDNFKLTKYVSESRGVGSNDWAAPATRKKVSYSQVDSDSVRKTAVVKKVSRQDRIGAAASSGDLAAAINQ